MDTRDTGMGERTSPTINDGEPDERQRTPEGFKKAPRQRRRSPALVASASFAVVAVIGTVITVVSLRDADNARARDTPPVTTLLEQSTQAPPVTTLPQQSTEAPAQSTQAPVLDPVPVTTVGSDVADAVDPAEAEWLEITPWGRVAVPDTRYRSTEFGVPFSFVPPGGWTSRSEKSDRLAVDADDWTVVTHLVVRVGLGSIQETVQAFDAAHAVLGGSMTEPVETEVGGAAGVVFETTGLPHRVEDHSAAPFVADNGVVLGSEHGLVYVVDVDGTTVTIIYFSSGGRYQEYLEEASATIESITWKDLD